MTNFGLALYPFTNQDDIVPETWEALKNYGLINSLAGNDKIKAKGSTPGSSDANGVFNTYEGIIHTGNGRDTITGAAYNNDWGSGIYNLGSIDTGNDDDYISTYDTFIWYGDDTYYGAFENHGMVSLGDGNNMLDAMVDVAAYGPGEPHEPAIWNSGIIQAGKDNDMIFSNTTIYNDGLIDTGNGNDALVAFTTYEGVAFTTYGGFDGSGDVSLGGGDDYLRGFGSGDYDGGSGQDSLLLTPGTYTIGIGGSANVSFTGNGKVMQTFGFEKLILGTTHEFTSLYDGQTIVVWP
jgi:hypothetical protein